MAILLLGRLRGMDDSITNAKCGAFDSFNVYVLELAPYVPRCILVASDAKVPSHFCERYRVLWDIGRLDEYHTRCLVVAAWDRMDASGEFRELGL